MKVQILMVSRERYFTEVFGNYMSSARSELTLLCFTDFDKARAYLETNRGQLRAVLADEDFLAGLGETSLPRIALAGHTAAQEGGVSRLNIYQRKRDIQEDLTALLVSVAGLSQGKRAAGRTRVLGFFSTQGGGGKSTAAYLAALCAGEGKKAAYLNLESGAFTGALYTGTATGMDELLYAIKERRALAPLLMNTLARNGHGVYTLPPMAGIGDRLELEAADVRFLLDEIEALGDFDQVSLDLDAGLPPFVLQVLEGCDLAVAVYSDTPTGRGKLDALQNDPSRSVLGLDSRLIILGNQCRQKYSDGPFDIMLPFSQSIERGTDLYAVVGANRELAAGAAGLAAAAQRQGAAV